MISKSKIKYIQSLGQKKFRQAESSFIAEGPKVVAELLNAVPAQVTELFALSEWITDNKKLASQRTVTEISADELARISQLAAPNQVLAIVKQFEHTGEFTTAGRITVVLDGIQDPGNLGTIIRIADWFGIEQVLCSPDCADIYNSKVVQSTMGSIARVQVRYGMLPEWLHTCGVRIYAAALEGVSISAMNKISEGVIIIGNESKGISPAVLEMANVKITIERKGKAESLNAAVAAGIILSHIQ